MMSPNPTPKPRAGWKPLAQALCRRTNRLPSVVSTVKTRGGAVYRFGVGSDRIEQPGELSPLEIDG